MKLKLILLLFICFISGFSQAKAQKVYHITSGEMIFSQSQSSFTQSFINQYPAARLAADNVRYTVFFHLGQYVHYDFNNSVGFFSGLAVRNVGMITDESLPQTVTLTGASVPYNDLKIIRRQYMLGIPLALKIGTFKNHFYIYGGGEYEMAFLMKENTGTGILIVMVQKPRTLNGFLTRPLPSFPLYLPVYNFPEEST